MALPTGTISMSQVNEELGLSATAQISLNDAAVRTLAGVGGAGTVISMDDLRGKSNAFRFSIASNQTNANLRTLAVNAGWDETAPVEATINSGVFISSNATGTPALTVSGSFPNGVELINNGNIVGRGGNGGQGGGIDNVFGGLAGTAGAAGGLALSVSIPITITNNTTIAGGGGGGGGGGSRSLVGTYNETFFSGGGGGGGGRSSLTNSSGGAGGVARGADNNAPGAAGGAGTSSSQGGGGGGGSTGGAVGGNGGGGGNWGAGGASGAAGSGGTLRAGPYGGGAAGAAVSGNSNITWLATGTRIGPIV